MTRFPRLLLYGLLSFASAASAQEAQPELRLHPAATPLPHQYMGPFVHGPRGTIIGIEGNDVITSRDKGQTWQSHPIQFDSPAPPKFDLRPERVLLRTRAGTLIVAFMNGGEKHWTWKNDLHDAPGAVLPTYVARSTDAGNTWTDLTKLHDDWTGAMRDIIETQDGRIVFTSMKMQHDPGRHACLTYSSDNDGRTWKPSNLIDLGGKGHHGGVTEPTLIELQDGRVWMLIRTNWGEFWSGYSRDGGRFWRTLQPSGIPASSAPGILHRLDSGRIVLLWNRPYPEGQDEFPLSGGDGIWSEVPVSNHRSELSIAFSDDDAKTWTEPVVIAAQPPKWLAYPYVFEATPGTLWITTMQGPVRIAIREADFVGGR